MKNAINFCFLLLFTYTAVAQRIELLPDTKTNVSLPQLAYQQILAIQKPERGSLVYDSTARCVRMYNGVSWDCLHRGTNNPEATAVWKPSHDGDVWGVNHTTDSEGNIYVSGTAFQSTIFGDNVNIPTGIGRSAFIVKYSPQGKALWVKYSTAGLMNIWDMVIGSDSKLSLLATASGEINFGVYHQADNNSSNAMLMKMDLNGNTEWTKMVYVASPGILLAQELTLDAQNNVYICGKFSGEMTFSNTNERVQQSEGYYNGFYMKYNASGTFVWCKKVSASTELKIEDLQVVADGDLYMAAIFSGTTTIGSAITSAGESDLLLMKADNAGNLLWGKREGGAKAEYATKIALVDGKVFVSGSLITPSTIGGVNLTSNLPSGFEDSGEMFYGLFNPDTQTWDYVKKSDNGGVFDVTRLKTDSRGNFYTCGSFNPSLKLGNKTLTEATNGNAFYVKGNMLTGDIMHFNGYSSPTAMDFGVSYGLYKNNKNVLIGSFNTETNLGEYRLRNFFGSYSSIFIAIVEE